MGDGGAATDWTQYKGWNAAYKGLDLYHKALLYTIGFAIFGFFLLLFIGITRMMDDPQILAQAYLGGLVLLTVLGLVGILRYASIPQETGGKELAYVAFALWLCRLLFDLLNLGDVKVVDAGTDEFIGLGPLAGLLGFCAFVLSLRKVSQFIESYESVSSCNTVLGLMAAAIVGNIGFPFVAMEMARTFGGLVMVVPLLLAGLALGSVIMFLSTIATVKVALLDGALEDGDL